MLQNTINSLGISPKEIECIKWAANDKTIKETSAIMHLAPATVKSYRHNIMNKIGVSTIAGGVFWAVKHGIPLD